MIEETERVYGNENGSETDEMPKSISIKIERDTPLDNVRLLAGIYRGAELSITSSDGPEAEKGRKYHLIFFLLGYAQLWSSPL